MATASSLRSVSILTCSACALVWAGCGSSIRLEEDHGSSGVSPVATSAVPASPTASSHASGSAPGDSPPSTATPGPGIPAESPPVSKGSLASSGDKAPGAQLNEPMSVENKYPGRGLVVHEWGTNTTVIGSDGVLLRGLHHEGDDLPAFVYDRLKQADGMAFPSVDKMETPVDYFYSDSARDVRVKVSLPDGVLTQWYPAVSALAPPVLVAAPRTTVYYFDPVAEVHYDYRSTQCSSKYGVVSGGLLDWGNVHVLAPNAEVELPDAPLDRFSWAYARDVKANAVRVDNVGHRDAMGTVTRAPETERFLFYRGLGNFAAPLRITGNEHQSVWYPKERASVVELTVPAGAPSVKGPVFVLNVDGSRGEGGFTVTDCTITPNTPFVRDVPERHPTLGLMRPMADFVEQLSQVMTEKLVAAGLYSDEATAMVNTWRRQWFATPGVRVLYFAPTAWIDAIAPLTIDPPPTQVVRVMVMRAEVVTTLTESEDATRAFEFSSPDQVASSRAYFSSLGRFAEPRLRRALSLLKTTPDAAATFLAQIEAPNASSAVGE